MHPTKIFSHQVNAAAISTTFCKCFALCARLMYDVARVCAVEMRSSNGRERPSGGKEDQNRVFLAVIAAIVVIMFCFVGIMRSLCGPHHPQRTWYRQKTTRRLVQVFNCEQERERRELYSNETRPKLQLGSHI